jgi:hypothetical protein
MLTVLAPTFNRARTWLRPHNSLACQRGIAFERLVADAPLRPKALLCYAQCLAYRVVRGLQSGSVSG